MGCALGLTTLALIACVALKLVPDVMADRAEQLAHAALTEKDPPHLAQLNAGIESWSRFGDYIAWGVGTLILGGSLVVIGAAYLYVFQPLFALASSMRRFTDGERGARAKASPCLELAMAAGNFNEMADTITGQHERMLDFIGATTCELKEPVHVMRSALEEFAPNKPPPAGPLAAHRMTVVLRELDRLEHLVENYLDASRVEWRRLDLQQERHDLRTVVNQVSRMYETFSELHRIELSLPERPIHVFADLDRLSQVIHTLLTNAIAFSPRGGVVEVCLHVAKNGSPEVDLARLSVKDHGIGISEEDLATIFEPFQKVSSALQRSPGVSVALSVARRIVLAHRGKLTATSKVGEGSTFEVCLPLVGPLGTEEALAGRAVANEGRAASPPPQANATSE
jgi:signal transduction histidine kinase